MEIGVLGSIAYDNIFTVKQVPVLGERVFGTRMGKYIGGMAANQAIEAARYTNKVNILGCIGVDFEGEQIIGTLREKGVKTRFLYSDKEHGTGQTYMYLMNDDYYSIVTPGANLHVDPDLVAKSIHAMNPGYLLISLEINKLAARSAFEAGKIKDFELILIPSPVENCQQDFLDLADSVILNKREFQIIFNLDIKDLDSAEKQLHKFIGKKKRILVTLGKQGAALLNEDQIYLSQAIKVNSVDSIGAGDALAGAFIGSLLNGIHPRVALSMGCIAGALVTSTVGPQSSQHTFSDVNKLYKKYYEYKGVQK